MVIVEGANALNPNASLVSDVISTAFLPFTDASVFDRSTNWYV